MPERLESLLPRVQKPARYAGGELHSVVKSADAVNIRFAFCFPDLYEVGMSHLGMKILYGLLNAEPDIWCERVFMPDGDMLALMEAEGIPLFGLESREAVGGFDFIGFTLQYELCYTTTLHMLELAGVPLLAADRDNAAPLVIGGGPCVCNPEPLADFFDLFCLGEGEEVTLELMALYRRCKAAGFDRRAFLREAARIEGVYVPSLYEVTYHADGTPAAVSAREDAPARVRKRVVTALDAAFYPDNFVVPFVDIVHDRAVAEVFRGCIRGCRFCQAGFLYRPVREKSAATVNRQSRALCESTGYEEFSLASLSTGDYSGIQELLPLLLDWTEPTHTNVSLPSMRMDGFPDELIRRLSVLRRAGLTFAPEAGTQRLRDVINKNLSEEDILGGAGKAFAAGWSSVKLYFMMGLPTETAEDIAGIARLAEAVVERFYATEERAKGKTVSVSASVACFVPKPFTPFQWEPQDTRETLAEKQRALIGERHSRKVSISWHDGATSFIEAVLARGDRRLGRVLLEARRQGFSLDAWGEHFSLERWLAVFAECGLDPAFYANRRREYDEILPWDHLDYGVSKAFLIAESERARRAEVTPNCRQSCAGCGAAVFGGGLCHEDRADAV